MLLAAVVVTVVGGLLAFVFLLAAAFSHQRGFGTAAVGALSFALLGIAAMRASQTYLLARFGAWRDLGHRRLTRQEQPVRFVVCLTLNFVYVAIACATAGYLIWAVVLPGFHGS